MSLVSTRYGKMRIIDSDQVVSRSLFLYGEWAQDELALLCQLIPASACVLDVGAFIGTHTIAFSQFVGSDGKVYAFEPRQEIYGVLRENISLNTASNVTAFHMGLAENAHTLCLSRIDTAKLENFGSLSLLENQSPNFDTYEVKISTVDDLDFAKIDLIKLDVEGMERRVLEGAVKSIARHRPIIFCECNSLSSGAELLEFCADQHYNAYIFLASAYNPGNFNQVKENIFGNSKELALLLIPTCKFENDLDNATFSRLLPVTTLEDLVLPLLHKPQYAKEVLANTSTSKSLGIDFPSPAVVKYMQEVAELRQEMSAARKEVARVKSSFSWMITKPLRAAWNVLRPMLPNGYGKPKHGPGE
jgi:FkbM family methyltransferase